MSDDLRAVIEVERDAELWGTPYRITPRLVGEPVGDGAQLIWFETMDSRPDFWVLRVDSSWDLDNLEAEQLEEVESAIEDAFGLCICGDADDPDMTEPPSAEEIANCAFPVLHNGSGGCRWGAYSP